MEERTIRNEYIIKSIAFLIFFMISISSLPSTGYACQCSSTHIPVMGAIKSDSIFYGTVLDIKEQREEDTSYHAVLFDVKNTIRGQSQTNLEIKQAAFSCDYHFEIGKEYLVYAYNVENELFTTLCDQKAAAKDFSIVKYGLVITALLSPLIFWRVRRNKNNK